MVHEAMAECVTDVLTKGRGVGGGGREGEIFVSTQVISQLGVEIKHVVARECLLISNEVIIFHILLDVLLLYLSLNATP